MISPIIAISWLVRLSVCLSTCMTVTLVHPAKTVGRNEMPFGRDARVTQSNTVNAGSGPPGEGEEILGRNRDQSASVNSKHLQ